MAGQPPGHWFLDWLQGSYSDRERFRAMHSRFRAAWVFGLLIGGCTVVAAATYGWWLVVLPASASMTMAVGLAQTHTRRPEVVGAVTFFLLEINLAVSVLFTGGGSSPLLSLMVVPIFTQAVAFRPPVTLVWVALSAALVVGVIGESQQLPPAPESPHYLQAMTYLALLGCLALAAHYLASADVQSRDDATQDALTGLLNRRALISRFDHIETRLRTTEQALTLLMVDVDHFKAINDSYGHLRGDQVLRHLSTRLLAKVRPIDLVFRIGGEEFLILMPGVDHDTARFAAERLTQGVSEHPLAGLHVTVSVGMVTASGPEVQYDFMAQAADAALYRAKQEGRNCIRTAA